MDNQKTILVAPLNWGLGHATRCIPIINALLERGFKVVLASDGAALNLLREEFPKLPFEALAPYNIRYAAKKKNFKFKLLTQSPAILKAIKEEKKQTASLVTKYNLDGIVSDNRFGVRSKKVPSVIITHQLRVLSGATTWISAALNQKYLKKFTQIWVPDFKGKPNLAGQLAHNINGLDSVVYLGPLSRLKKKSETQKYDLLILLSGPEPQRSILEKRLIELYTDSEEKIILVRGVLDATERLKSKSNFKIVNYLTSSSLEKVINESRTLICRSGYTTLMDLSALEKRAFLIPTPGQYEQEYLAKRLQEKGMLPYTSQRKFNPEDVQRIKLYNGLPKLKTVDYSDLFGLF